MSSVRAESPMATEATEVGPVDDVTATAERTTTVEENDCSIQNKAGVATNGEMLDEQLQSSPSADECCQSAEEKQRKRSLEEADDGGDEEEDGTISDIDVSSDLDDDEDQESMLQRQKAERDTTETADNARSSTAASRSSHISQYHSIQQLSSPATNGMMQQQTAAAAAAAAAAFCGQLLDYSLHTPSEMMFRRTMAAAAAAAAARGTSFAGPEDGAADSVQMLRGMISRQEQQLVESASSSRRRIQFDERQSDRKQKKYDDEDEEDEWARANEATTGSDDFGSYDGELGNSVGGSLNASMTSSSADEMSDGGYADEPLDVRKKSSNNNVDDEFDGHSGKARSVSDEVRECCNPLEAKRARMESIVTSMRHSPKSATSASEQQQPQPLGGSTSTPTSSASNPSAAGSGGTADDAKRRPKRKQYIPKQHDASTLEHCVDDQLDAAAEDISSASAAKKMALDVDRVALEAELRSLNEQLEEVRLKYAHIFGGENSAWSKQQLAGFGCGEYYSKYFSAGAAERLYSVMQSSSSSLTNGVSKPSAGCASGRGKGSGAENQSSPIGGDTPIDVEKLVAMLKAEIASGIGSFVEDTVKGFVEKYRLQIGGTQPPRRSGCHNSDLQHRQVPSTAGFCKSETAAERTAPGSQQRREEMGRSTLVKTTSVCSSVENLSKDGDVDYDDVDDKAQVYHHGHQQQTQHPHHTQQQQQQQLRVATTPTVSPPFPGLLLPTALRPLTNDSRGADATASHLLNSAVDDRHRKAIGSPFFDGRQASILGGQTSTAFEMPPRTAATHHSLYPLFAPHAYYPPSRAMLSMAAAAAAAAAATTGGIFPGSTPSATTAAATPIGTSAGAAQNSSTSSLFHCREPEQTEALPLVVSAPTKKKRTKVTDTRLSPRAARSMLLQESLNGSSHLSSVSASHHHHHRHAAYGNGHVSRSTSEQLQQRHLGHRGSSASFGHRADGIKGEDGLDGSRASPQPRSDAYRSGCAAALPSSVSIPSLLPSSLPTSVAVPNPSLQHSDIMHAIMQFSQQRLQHQQLDGFGGMSQRYAAAAASGASASAATVSAAAAGPFGGGDRFDIGKQPVSGTSQQRDDETCSDGYPGSLTGRKSDVMQMSNSNDVSYDQLMFEDGLTSTLTPMHLRKAKLMFFYVRYPSSAILKVYFPDVRFNKNNTAQLIKWFSNFREFYYIQMEKYARQALAEGVKNAADMHVSTESELYRVLVLHYNRNNQIEVPDSFRTTVQATLREFFKSIQADKDQEPSWKKAIYKIIARLDDTVPEYFKSPNWLQQLADG